MEKNNKEEFKSIIEEVINKLHDRNIKCTNESEKEKIDYTIREFWSLHRQIDFPNNDNHID